MAATLIAGVQHIRDGLETSSVFPVDMSKIAIVGTAPNADAGVFPLNQAVAFYSNVKSYLTALGATGTIPDALKLISAQLKRPITAIKVIVVRVTDNVAADTVIANIIGDEGSGSGLWALLDAPADLGEVPRLIITPGYTSQQKQGIKSGAITPGSGGANGTFDLGFTGGTGSGAAGTFTVTGGSITAVTITNPGVYTVVPTATFAGSAGLTGASVVLSLEQLANPICAIVPTICERLNAYFIPEGPTSSRAAWLDWFETLPRTARHLHPLRNDARVYVGTEVVQKPLSPAIAALYGRVDAEHGGVPSHSIANQQVYGIVGVVPTIPMSITNPAIEGQDDLELGAGITWRGDAGVDDSLTDGGFVFWGTDTLSDEIDWVFAHVNRMRTYIEIMQVKAIRKYLGKENITLQTVQKIANTLEAQMSPLKADEHILDYRVEFDRELNTIEEIRQGNIDIIFKCEEPPVLRKVIIRSRRMAEAIASLVARISVSLNSQQIV